VIGTDENSPDMHPLDAFVSRFGSPAAVTLPSSHSLDSLPPGFPDSLCDYWRVHGFGAYAEGLIWTHPLSDFEAIIEEWVGTRLKDAVLLVRFSFGDFVLWTRKRVFFVSVHRGYVEELPSDVSFLFDEMLCDDVFLEKFARRSLHLQCNRRLGALSTDQCFGFVPALALGGAENADAVSKVQMGEHLAFLAQVNGPVKI
jgi:hypothetical protein